MKNIFFTIGLLFSLLALGQQSIHQEQSEFYKQFGDRSEAEFDELFRTAENLDLTKKACNLEYDVYGWHPYWVGTAYNNYDFNLLSTFSYFSYELDPSTGNYNSIHSWKTSPSIDMAKAAGCRVELCVTNFGASNNTTFLTNPTAQQTFIDSIISLINYRQAHGVNIDFEGIAGSDRNNLTNFMIMLSNQLKAAIPGATVTMATFSVDWNDVFDFATLNNYVDKFIIMGYGYYYSGSSKAGPTDPLYSGSIWSPYNLIRSMLYHLDEGVSKDKLVLGLPYYGYEWETVDNSVPGNTTGNFYSSRTYAYVRNNTSGNYSNKLYDMESETPYFQYQNGGDWRQAFVCDEYSLAKRLDWIKSLDIGGMGIWALGYDDGYQEFWDVIRDKFSTCAVEMCTDTVYDTGGAFGKYRANEDYTYTITPGGSASFSVEFEEFDIEAGSAGNCDYDYLEIFDGADVNAPLIGKYCNDTGAPGLIQASGGSITLRFHSDGATQNNGWKILVSCIVDTIKPTTLLGSIMDPVADDFTLDFTDEDNVGGSGVDHIFYQVADTDGSEWRANSGNGFFNDDFDNSIHSDWIDSSGVWAVTGGYLAQTDEANGNTNLFADCDQNNSSKFLYHFKTRLNGTGGNRRAGFHYMCDDASQTERGNSYFIWYRLDDSKLQFYKVVNNSFSLEKEVPLTFNGNQWYDVKVVYDKLTGKTEVWWDDEFIGDYVDANPYTVGNQISFRSGNCIFDADELRVYKTRTNSELITVGQSASDDIRYQGTPAGAINSIAIDSAKNVSTITTSYVNVDLSTGVEGVSQDLIQVFPNPVKDLLTIQGKQRLGKIEITDVAGKIVFSEVILSNKTTVNTAELPNGVYILKIDKKVIKLVKN